MTRVHFIGAGLSEPELLVKEAWDILSTADVALVVEDAWDRNQWPWPLLREDVVAHAVGDRLRYWLERKTSVVVLVPQAPAFNPFMGKWVEELRAEQVTCAIVPGLWDLTATLDYQGYCVSRELTLHSGPAPVFKFSSPPRRPESLPAERCEERWTLEGQSGGDVTVTSRAVAPHFWKAMGALSTKHILVVESGPAATRARRFLRECGAKVTMGTVAVLTNPAHWDEVDEALNHVERFDWVVFTSQEGLNRFWLSLQRLRVDVRRMRAQVAVVGQQTAQSLRDHGVYPHLMPNGDYSQEGLAAAFSAHPLLGKSVLLVQGDLNRQVLADALAQRGAILTLVQFYRNQNVELAPEVCNLLHRRAIDAIFYTASSAAERLFGTDAHLRTVLQDTLAVSIGSQTSRTLRRLGARAVCEPARSSAEEMVKALIQYYTTQK